MVVVVVDIMENMDVNETRESRVSIFFLDPEKGISRLPRIETDRTDNRPTVSGIIVTGRSALAISRSLVASWRPWPAYQTHGCRRRETNDSGGWGQRKQMFLPP